MEPSSPSSPPLLLARAFGAAMAVGWALLALTERSAWSRLGLLTLAASALAALSFRPLAVSVPRVLMAPPRAVFVGACAVSAGGVSWWLVRQGLRDTPLSIDAGAYLMQARAMAHFHFGMPLPFPRQVFSNRFSLEGPDGRLYGIFPPGWPLAVVPFLWVGAPMLVGPVVAGLLVVAQAALGRGVARAAGDEASGDLATRASLLLTLPSYARAMETADVVSHAFVALLATVAMTCAIDVRAGARAKTGPGKSVLLGVCVGWAVAARLLDGALLGLAVLGLLIWNPVTRRALAWVVAGAAPLLVLLAVEQHVATGQWLVPTQTAYFARSDWPATCHRLGFGSDVGCTVEHGPSVASFGPGGYDARAALRVVRERAGALGEDLLGFAPLAFVAFVPAVIGASGVETVGVAFLLALTLAYGLFYNGNAPFYGARHLFPAAPFLWLAAARGSAGLPHRARGWLDAPHVTGAGLLVTLTVAAVCARGPWSTRGHDAAEFQSHRSDLRRAFALHGVARGILKTRDHTEVAAAFDPWADGAERLFVFDDASGLTDLRRAHPDLPVYISLPGDELGKLHVGPPPPGVLFELERAWPSFVRPRGLATSRAWRTGASGGAVLQLSHAQPGAEAAIPFEVAVAGDYLVRVDGLVGPDQGDYELTLDGLPLPDWHGFASDPAPRRGVPAPRALGVGRHVLVARCVGRDAASRSYDALLDVLEGDPLERIR